MPLAAIGAQVILGSIKITQTMTLSARNARQIRTMVYEPDGWGGKATIETGGIAMIA